MEDVAIAYGFNKLPRSSPNKAATIGQPLLINKLTDIVRYESAMAGWTEVLPLSTSAGVGHVAALSGKPTSRERSWLTLPASSVFPR